MSNVVEPHRSVYQCDVRNGDAENDEWIEKEIANEHDARYLLLQSAQRYRRRSVSLFSKQDTRSSTRLSVLDSSLLKRKSQWRAAISLQSISRHKLTRRSQQSEENILEKTEKPRKQLDLRSLKMGELHHIARDLGRSKAEIDVIYRWSLVGYIERHERTSTQASSV